jgi:hypothetical protein
MVGSIMIGDAFAFKFESMLQEEIVIQSPKFVRKSAVVTATLLCGRKAHSRGRG